MLGILSMSSMSIFLLIILSFFILIVVVWRRLKLKFSLRTLLLLVLLIGSSVAWFKNQHAWKPLTAILLFKEEYFQIEFSPTNNRLVVWGKDKRLSIWDLSTGYCELEQKLSVPVNHILYARDGRGILLHSPNEAYLFDIESKKVTSILTIKNPEPGPDPIPYESLIAVSPDGSKIALEVTQMVKIPSGGTGTQSNQERKIRIRTTSGTGEPFEFRFKGSSLGLARFSNEGNRFGVSVDSRLHIIDLDKQKEIWTVPASGSWGCRFTFMPKERIAVINSFDAVKIFNGIKGTELGGVPAESQYDIAYSTQSDWIATSSPRQGI